MESSYKRFNNIGEDDGSLATFQNNISNGPEPPQFGGSSSNTDSSYLPTSSGVPLRQNASHVPIVPQIKRNNENCNIQQQPMQKQRVRLRALETETEYFLRLLVVSSIKKLLWAQMAACSIILMAQVILYATASPGSWKAVDLTGIGIWAPLFIFSVASGLALMAVKSPGGCILGTAMGFQIGTAGVSTVLVLLSSISLLMHGRWDYVDERYDHEVLGRILCSLMLISSVVMVITSIFISVQFCRATCCGRSRASEAFLFDVETIKL